MGTGLRTWRGAARGTPVPTLMGGTLCAPPRCQLKPDTGISIATRTAAPVPGVPPQVALALLRPSSDFGAAAGPSLGTARAGGRRRCLELPRRFGRPPTPPNPSPSN